MNADRQKTWQWEVTRLVRIAVVLAIVFLVTLPFGFYRTYTRKLSLRWFLAIHVPVILVFLTRYEAHLSYVFIPLTCVAFAAAQVLGGKTGRWWGRRRPAVQATTTALAAAQQKAPLPQGLSVEP
jgi:hypothetical protein